MPNDPITAEVIRHGLAGAAEHMRRALCRMAFSVAIYEANDFTAGLFDHEARLLAQARSVPAFLGTLGLAIEAVVASVGGKETLEPGDVLVSTNAYDIGSHSADASFIVPGFIDGRLIGYAAVKAHLTDIGAKDIVCTDTTDIFQEGLILPGVRLYRSGELQDDIYRILLMNSRAPEAMAGDVTAIVAAARMGLAELQHIVGRYGLDTFHNAVETMFDHGEAMVRELISTIPDGRYSAQTWLDNNGMDEKPIAMSVSVDVSGSEITVDLTDAPPMQIGPMNCPVGMTISTIRGALMSIVGGAEECNEGFFRSLRVETTPGTIVHAVHPAAVFTNGWPVFSVFDGMHRALAGALPDRVPARSGGDVCATMFVGVNSDTGQFWLEGGNHSVGPGASSQGDQGGPTMHITASGLLTFCPEAIEARGALRLEQYELAPDSAGPGRFRGGLGVAGVYRTLHDCELNVLWEQTLTPAWGLQGGKEAQRNWWRVTHPDGATFEGTKLGGHKLPAGSVLEVRTGGGGGWGPPEERDVATIHSDVREGYISEESARRDYPHAYA